MPETPARAPSGMPVPGESRYPRKGMAFFPCGRSVPAKRAGSKPGLMSARPMKNGPPT